MTFQFGEHRLSAFIFQNQPARKALSGRGELKQYAPFWIETWRQDGLRYIVVGDTSAGNMRRLSNLIRDAAGSN